MEPRYTQIHSSSSSLERKRLISTEDVWKGKTSSEPCPCTECGKKFWSWKALFGHMRCHPEREWRGINPPPNFKRQSNKQQKMLLTHEDHEVAACLLLLANGNAKVNNKEEFECSSCNKVFGSHQALGGHRASHKNVKGCFAITTDDMNVNNDDGHKCSICLRVFSTGQALGGHKRCHWEKGDSSPSPNSVDLNFPPPDSPPDLRLRL